MPETSPETTPSAAPAAAVAAPKTAQQIVDASKNVATGAQPPPTIASATAVPRPGSIPAPKMTVVSGIGSGALLEREKRKSALLVQLKALTEELQTLM